MRNLLKDAKVVKVSSGASAGQTAVTGTHVDMSGFNSVLFIADLGAVTDGCVLSLKAQDGNAANDSDQADITGATTGTLTASGNSNSLVVLDVQRTQARYVRPVLGRTTQNAVVNSIIAVLYNADSRPVTLDPTVILSAEVVAAG